MKTRITLIAIALFMAINVAAQPPRVKEEARRQTNHLDRQVGLSRGQYSEIYRINLRFAQRQIGPERRDRAYRQVLSNRQWDIYTHRRGGGPRPDVRRDGRGPRRDAAPRRGDYRRDYRDSPRRR